MENADFLSLQVTNAAPTSHDKALIYDKISGIDRKILQADESIAILERELQKLKFTREEHIHCRSGYINLMSPLRSMPLEILGEIFLLATAQSLSARLQVSHVCQLWRKAALSNSEMWSTINWKLGRLDTKYFQACISRAGSRPLVMHLGTPQKLQTSLSAFLEVVTATSSSRWKEFSWEYLDLKFFGPLLKHLASGSHDTLEDLVLESALDMPVAINSQFPAAELTLGSFSHLTSLYLILNSEPLEQVTLDAPQLTELSINCSEAHQATLYEIFRKCLNLEECTISISTFHLPSLANPSQQSPIRLNNLRKLHLFHSDKLFSGVTGSLVTPVIEELILHIPDAAESDFMIDGPVVYKFLRASASTLRRLWIGGIAGNRVRDDIIHLKRLEELTLFLADNERRVAFRALTVKHAVCHPFYCYKESDLNFESYFPLPHLRAMRIVSRIEVDDQLAFLNLVDSRWWTPSGDMGLQLARPFARLQHASLRNKYAVIENDSNPENLVAMELGNFRRDGLNVGYLGLCGEDVEPNFRRLD